MSAGESHYVLEAFGRRWLSGAVGWMVILTGVVSAATLARAFARFAETLVAVPDEWVIVAIVIGLGLVAAWGIAESVWLATIITIIEVRGLLFVFFAGSDHPANLAGESYQHDPANHLRARQSPALGHQAPPS